MKNNWQLRHLGIVVRDMDKVLDYYRSLGLATFGPEEVKATKRDEIVHGELRHYSMRGGKMLQMGNITLELIQPVEGNSLHQEFLDKHGEGLHHICFFVDDLEKERMELVKRGIPIALMRQDKSRFTYFEIMEGGNLLIELTQR